MQPLRPEKRPSIQNSSSRGDRRAQRRLHDQPIDVVVRLAEDIGPRRATTLAEARTAAYLDGRLRLAGMRVSADRLAAPASVGWDGVLLGLLALVSTVLYYWLPLPSLGLAFWSLALAVWRLWRADLPLLVRRRASQNVIGTRANGQVPRWRVVLLAPLDAPAVMPAPVRWLMDGRRPVFGRALACALLALFALVGLLHVDRLWWYAQFVLAGYLVLTALFDIYLMRAPGSPGAISHGSALAVLLASATGLADINQIELWAVGLGATASSTGLADMLRRYPFEPERTLFIGLEGLGCGSLAYLTREGELRASTADPLLVRLAAAADMADPLIDVEPRPFRGIPTIAATLRQAGWKALTITALGPDGRVPYRASAADQPEQVDPALLDRAVRLVIGLVRQIDATGADD